MKPIVKIVIFIGLLLLVIAVCAYGYLTYKEGFQIGSGIGTGSNSGSFCPLNDLNASTCPGQCQLNYNPDPNALPPETAEEQITYDMYEYYNLSDLSLYLPTQSTPLSPYNIASQLSSFDSSAPIPWDYDNAMLDPQQVLWGTVATPASQGIFNVAYTTAIFGSSNSADYIASNPENNTKLIALAFSPFETPSFLSAQTVNFLNSVTTLTTMLTTQMILSPYIGVPSTQGVRRHLSVKAVQRTTPGATYQQASKALDGALESRVSAVTDVFKEKDKLAFMSKNANNATYMKNGVLTAAGEAKLSSRAALYQNRAMKDGFTTKETNKIWDSIAGNRPNPEKLGSVAKSSLKSAARMGEKGLKAEKSIASALRGFFKTGKVTGKTGFKLIMKPLSKFMHLISPQNLFSLFKKGIAAFGRMIARMLPKLIVESVVLNATAATLTATGTSLIATGKAFIAAAIAFTAATLGVAAPVTVPAAAAGAAQIAAGTAFTFQAGIYLTASIFLNILEFSCFSFIPAIMGSVYDPSISVCPKDHAFNLERAILELGGGGGGGELLLATLSGIPVFGALITAFGPYLCWNSDISNPVVLIETIHAPAYYYDPTLSFFTMEKTYTKSETGNIVSGMTSDDPGYYDPAEYKDENGIYPIWVDYSNRVMLDKMAQFYYDNSRKYMAINPDGTATFEYISKFYGIISSSEYSCDVQCEITEVTVNTYTGIKICERVVPPVTDGPCTWHDRRFYFYIDITRGVNLETEQTRACGDCLTRLQNMKDSGGNPASLPSGDPCIGILGNVKSMYDQYGQPISEKFNKAQMKCAVGTLMGAGAAQKVITRTDILTGAVTTTTQTSSNRASWSASKRMQDNMEKFFITGCTYIDGTAPAAADVSNQMEQGKAIGTSIVSLGMPGAKIINNSTDVESVDNTIEASVLVCPENPTYNVANFAYYPPTIGGAEAVSPEELKNLVPNDKTCDGTKKAFLTKGTVTSDSARKLASDIQNQVTDLGSTPILTPSKCPEDWVFFYPDNTSKHNIVKSAAFYDSSGNVQTAKYLNLNWSGCVQDPGANFNGAMCKMRNNWAEILYTSITGGFNMGSILNFPGLGRLTKGLTRNASGILKNRVSLGAIVVFSAVGAYTGIEEYLSCVTQDIGKESGTFMVNGNLVTTRSSPGNVNFMMFQGPIMPFSPGYSPTIDFKANLPDLSLANCVNRYTVRYFVNTFRSQYPGYQLKKIVNITPRRIVRNNPDVRFNNERPCCAFYVEYTTSTGGAPQYDMFGLPMTINGFSNATGSVKNVYLYQPSRPIFQPVPQAVAFNNITSPPDTIPASSGRPFQLLPPFSYCPIIDCGSFALQTRLFTQFNQHHMGANIDLDTSPDGKYNSVKRAYTPDFILNSGVQKCIYEVDVNTVTSSANPNILSSIDSLDPASFISSSSYTTGGAKPIVISNIPSLGTSETSTMVITMTLETIAKPTTKEETCLYDLYTDNYPDNIWYASIPVDFWEVPQPVMEVNKAFSSQTGFPDCIIDCSGSELMTNLVTQFNKKNSTTKINSISRSYTPLVSGDPVCDYDVEMVRNSGDRMLVNQETVRFYLKPTTPASCMFDLDRDDSVTPNSGLSLNSSTTLGMLNTPFTWSSSFIKTITNAMDGIMWNIQGLNGLKIINSISKNALTTVNSILNAASLTQTLQACPKLSCNHPYILQKILNRFNFNNYPAYPGSQYNVQKVSISQFRKAGISSPTQCHVELVEKSSTYGDMLYEPISDQFASAQGVQIGVTETLQKWAFDLIGARVSGTECKFTVKDLSGTDITNNTMNVNINAFSPLIAVKDTTGNYNANNIIVPPDLETRSNLNPALGALSVTSSSTFSYEEPRVNCLDPAVLEKVKSIYNKVNVATAEDKALTSTVKTNTLYTILKSFNPVPNVCEYQAQAVHTYYDSDYGWYYTVPDTSVKRVVFDKDDTTFLVAKWEPNIDYEIETGKLLLNSPTVTEYHLPNMEIIDKQFYNKDGTGPIDLPYIAGIGYTPNSINTTKPRFSSQNVPLVP